MNAVRKFFSSCLLAGVVVMGLGVYFLMFKAGIPYQDPPLELQIRYAIDKGTGEALFTTGLVLAVAGLAGRVAAKSADRLSGKKAAALENEG